MNAWKTNPQDTLETVNLFSFYQYPVKTEGFAHSSTDVQPSVYVGMYNKQLYIQESEKFKKELRGHQLDALNRNYLKIPWKPHPAKNALSLIGVDRPDNEVLAPIDDAEHSVTALSILYATEYANGNGFFLYSSGDLNRSSSCDKENGTNEKEEADEELFKFPFADDDTPTTIIIVSLWFWW